MISKLSLFISFQLSFQLSYWDISFSFRDKNPRLQQGKKFWEEPPFYKLVCASPAYTTLFFFFFAAICLPFLLKSASTFWHQYPNKIRCRVTLNLMRPNSLDDSWCIFGKPYHISLKVGSVYHVGPTTI